MLLTGNDLTVADIVAVGRGDAEVSLDAAALERCRESRDYLAQQVEAGNIIYGVNTSFGPMCNKIISDEQIEELQVNLIRSHSAGLGDPIRPDIAKAIAVIRLNTLVKGYSGVRLGLLEHMRDMINGDVAPYIPEAGSVGASGDLIHLAHLGLGIIGEGKLFHEGEEKPAAEALAAIGLEPYRLGFKEGIALMNGTAAMNGLAAFAVYDAQRLLRLSCITGAFGLEIFGGIDDAFDEDLHRVKPHPGQLDVAATIRNLYDGSRNITLRSDMHDRIRAQETDDLVFETDVNVQDVYSIRCTPQVLAPVAEGIGYATTVVETEANSTNDNPVIVPAEHKIIHGGNFHGQSIGFAMDVLSMALATLCNISERRLNKYLDPKLNEGLPEQLISGTVGLTMGFMGSQYLATSTTAENRQLANPVSTNSISTNASNQDVVSMGTVAARKAYRSASNSKHVMTLEVLAMLQALQFRNAEGLGRGTRRVYDELMRSFVRYDNERIFHDDLVKFRRLLFDGTLLDDLGVFQEEPV
ncbi:MAG: aromatic amino acid ammonia-lyase [Acidimicrobiia bacterium]